jgi:hypothetical protein
MPDFLHVLFVPDMKKVWRRVGTPSFTLPVSKTDKVELIKNFDETHKHLNLGRKLLLSLKDYSSVAPVDETRALS